MSLLDKPIKKKTQYKEQHQHKNIYSQLLITRTVPINITHIGDTIKATLEKAIASQIEGKCIVEGFIKPQSVEVITFSSGLVMGSNIIFEVVIQCEVCSPVEGMHIKCIAKHINKAGIRAEINETPSPVVIFIARDHNYASPLFAEVKENDEIKVKVIGQRFELNDKYISIIAEIIELDQTSEKASAEKKTTYKPAASVGPASAPASAAVPAPFVPIGPGASSPVFVPEAAASLGPAATSYALGPAPVTKKQATLRIKLPKTKAKN